MFLVDDEAAVREGMGLLLRSRRILSQAYESAEAFDSMLQQSLASDACWPTAPACLLLDMRMGGMSGMALFDRLAERGLISLMPVIFLTGHGDVPTAVAMIKRGAFDFVEKPSSGNSLVDKIEAALSFSLGALERRSPTLEMAQRIARLSPRERQVVAQVLRGRKAKDIASDFGVTLGAVEKFRAHAFEKLSVKSAPELAHQLHVAGSTISED